MIVQFTQSLYIIRTFPRQFSSTNCNRAASSNCRKQLTDNIFLGCFPYAEFRLAKCRNSSLEQINNQLFVKIWTNLSSYSNCFQTCKPLECQYTLSHKNNPICMLPTLLEFDGDKLMKSLLLLTHEFIFRFSIHFTFAC